MTDRELIEGCKRNDRACQEALYKRFAAKMKSICMRYLSNDKDDVEDVVQEGFIKIFKNIDQFNFGGPLGGWVRKTMVRTALTKVKQTGYSEEIELIPDMYEAGDYREIIGNISIKELRKLIASLPEGYRVVFNMFVIDGYTHEEIAAELKISGTTSRTQLFKARKMLQEKIKKSEIISVHE